MITIANPRAEKAARRLAKRLDTTISEAVAVACERLLGEQDNATLAKRRSENIERMWAENRQRGLLKGTPEERRKLADHGYLYGPDGLPK
jgi:hypothetical protein